MTQSTPKQREIADRERRILNVSRPMVAKGGYHGFSMDRIAEKLEYSKGTIYNHFNNKEEVIIALAIETTEKRAEMLNRAASFQGCPRERMLAAGIATELFVRIFPDHFKVENLIRIFSIWEKTSERRRMLMRSWENRCVNIVSGIVRDAVSSGDLKLSGNSSPEDLVFGLWSVSYGAYSIISTSDQLAEMGINEPFGVVRGTVRRLLDGYQWKPLSQDNDYDEVTTRVIAEVFAKEFSSL